jgi:Holliday junction resolvase RusA-like endonuclease
MVRLTLDVPVQRKAIAPRESVTLELPFPVSVNAMFANNGGPGRGRYKTQQYRDWLTAATWRILADKPGRIPGPVSVTLVYEEKNGRRDLDNLIKGVLDLLIERNVIDGDHRSIVREINAKWSKSVQGVRITISQATDERAAA